MKSLLIIFSMSPNLTLEQCPGTYLRNERFDGHCALFEEENVLPGLHLLTAGTLVKITLIKPYLLFQNKSAPEKHG